MNSRNASKPNVTRILIAGVLVCVLLWAYYVFLVGLLYSPPDWRIYPYNFIYYMLPPMFVGMYCYNLLHKGLAGKIAIFLVPLLVTILPIVILREDRSNPGVAWLFLTPITLSVYVGEFLAWLFHMSGAHHRFYLDELLAQLINAGWNRYQLYARGGLDKTLEEQKPGESLNVPDSPISPKLASVLHVVQDDAIATRTHFHTWWTLTALATPDYSDVLKDRQYADFFQASISSHYKLIFASLARLFDSYSTVAGIKRLIHLLTESERRDLARLLSNSLNGKEDMIQSLLKIGNQTIMHSHLSPRDKPKSTKPPITAEEIRELIDALCGAIDEVTIALDEGTRIPSGFRYEEAVFNLLRTLREAHTTYDLSGTKL